MRNRSNDIVYGIFAIFVGIVLTAVAAITEWFLSRPAGVTRLQATADLITFAEQTLTLSAVVGFAAMATLEIVKRLFHLRGWFFLSRVPGAEFLRSARSVRPGEKGEKEKGDPAEKEKKGEKEKSAEVDRWAGAGRFDLPLEQLMAQLGYATDQALDRLFPVRSSDSAPSQATSAEPPDAADDARRGSPEYKLLARLVGEASLKGKVDPTMLRIETQAALDDLQVSVGNAWRWRLRLTSCVLAALFALVALLYVPVPPGSKIAALAGSFLLGGFFAGFFRDLAAIVERFRSLWADILYTASQHENEGRVATLGPQKHWAGSTRKIPA